MVGKSFVVDLCRRFPKLNILKMGEGGVSMGWGGWEFSVG